MTAQDFSKLLVLWTGGDKDVALNMVFMYTINSKLKNWWGEVVLLIWGSSSKLAAVDADIQAQIATALKKGVRVIACKKCAENLGVVEQLEGLGIEVFYVGQFLTEWLKSGERVLTI
ncbi:MAG: DsrE family protein [Deltaproteobacteria bacterium]|nr:DsrE family protein [Deltaproteobacteria bacterium]